MRRKELGIIPTTKQQVNGAQDMAIGRLLTNAVNWQSDSLSFTDLELFWFDFLQSSCVLISNSLFITTTSLPYRLQLIEKSM